MLRRLHRSLPRVAKPHLGAATTRPLQTYAANPARWQADADVAAYGRCLDSRESDPGAFRAAAAQLRAREDLPADLRASAGRSLASEAFRAAAVVAGALALDPRAPWPTTRHDEAVHMAEEAQRLFTEVVVEGSDQTLAAAVAEYSPDWPSAVAATEAARAKAQALLLEVHMMEVRWLLSQVQLARAVAHATRSGDLARAEQLSQQLYSVGLPEGIREEQLLERAVARADLAGQALARHAGSHDEGPQIQLQSSLAELLCDLALACACDAKPIPAAGHMIRSLSVAAGAKTQLSTEQFDRLRETGQAIWEHCTKSIKAAGTAEAEQALRQSTDLGAALVHFNALRV